MSMSNESIYNLIPPEIQKKEKGPRYKSIYPPNIAPSYSTFGNQSTSKGISNVAGNIYNPNMNYNPINEKGTFGRQSTSPNPKSFLKKGEGQLINYSRLPRIQNEKDTIINNRYSQPLVTMAKSSIFTGSEDFIKKKLKEPIPRATEKPIMGLKSNKNFIVQNSINNILSSPPVRYQSVDFRNKREYGQIPKYLTIRNEQIKEEYRMIQSYVQQEKEDESKLRVLSEEEVQQLKKGLQNKWDEVNREYQTLTHLQKIDTRKKKIIKEGCEKQLMQLEKDMEKLQKQYIFVDNSK